MAWTAPRTWVTGELVTAAMMNTHVRDNLGYLKDAPVFDGGFVARTLVGTWGNRFDYDTANQIIAGIPGSGSSAKKFVIVDSTGATAASVDSLGAGIFNGGVRGGSATVPNGYTAGTGGTVTQITSKATGVTLNKVTGQITMNNANLNAGAYVSFVVTNSAVAAIDVIKVVVASGGTANAYIASVTAVAAGSFTITLQNITAGNLAEAPVLSFVVVKGQTT